MARKRKRATARLPFSEELTHNERLDLIGKYFVRVTRRLIGGKVPKNPVKTIGDIHHDILDALVEVKASGCPGDVRIFINQLERLMKTADGFPGFSHCHYALWFYKNWRGIRHGKRNGAARNKTYIRPLGKETPKEADLDRFLAGKTVAAWFVDGSILERMAQCAESTKQSIQWHKPSMIVRANRARLQALANDLTGTLAPLGLDAETFAVRRMTVTIRFRKNLMRFRVMLILPKRQVQRITRLIKQRIADRKSGKKSADPRPIK